MVKLWHLCVSPPYPKDYDEDFTALQPDSMSSLCFGTYICISIHISSDFLISSSQGDLVGISQL